MCGNHDEARTRFVFYTLFLHPDLTLYCSPPLEILTLLNVRSHLVLHLDTIRTHMPLSRIFSPWRTTSQSSSFHSVTLARSREYDSVSVSASSVSPSISSFDPEPPHWWKVNLLSSLRSLESEAVQKEKESCAKSFLQGEINSSLYRAQSAAFQRDARALTKNTFNQKVLQWKESARYRAFEAHLRSTSNRIYPKHKHGTSYDYPVHYDSSSDDIHVPASAGVHPPRGRAGQPWPSARPRDPRPQYAESSTSPYPSIRRHATTRTTDWIYSQPGVGSSQVSHSTPQSSSSVYLPTPVSEEQHADTRQPERPLPDAGHHAIPPSASSRPVPKRSASLWITPKTPSHVRNTQQPEKPLPDAGHHAIPPSASSRPVPKRSASLWIPPKTPSNAKPNSNPSKPYSPPPPPVSKGQTISSFLLWGRDIPSAPPPRTVPLDNAQIRLWTTPTSSSPHVCGFHSWRQEFPKLAKEIDAKRNPPPPVRPESDYETDSESDSDSECELPLEFHRSRRPYQIVYNESSPQANSYPSPPSTPSSSLWGHSAKLSDGESPPSSPSLDIKSPPVPKADLSTVDHDPNVPFPASAPSRPSSTQVPSESPTTATTTAAATTTPVSDEDVETPLKAEVTQACPLPSSNSDLGPNSSSDLPPGTKPDSWGECVRPPERVDVAVNEPSLNGHGESIVSEAGPRVDTERLDSLQESENSFDEGYDSDDEVLLDFARPVVKQASKELTCMVVEDGDEEYRPLVTGEETFEQKGPHVTENPSRTLDDSEIPSRDLSTGSLPRQSQITTPIMDNQIFQQYEMPVPRRIPSKISPLLSWSDVDPSSFPREIRKTVEDIILQPYTKPWEDVDMIRTDLYQIIVDSLQVALDYSPEMESGFARSAAIKCLQAISRISDVLPSDLALQNVQGQSKIPIAGGGFADIYDGTYRSQRVCLKVLRVFTSDDPVQAAKTFRREALLWRQLHHPRILPLLGIRPYMDPRLCLVSPWMHNGNVNQFLRKHSTFDRLKMLIEIIEGIEYLHTHDPPIVHADIRGANILVRDDFTCCLADFGLTTSMGIRTITNSWFGKGTSYWMSPEVWNENVDADVPARDIYSFGCTVIELYSGQHPFPDITLPTRIYNEVVVMKHKPPRPRELYDPKLWVIVDRCLAFNPWERPSASDVFHMLKTYGVSVSLYHSSTFQDT